MGGKLLEHKQPSRYMICLRDRHGMTSLSMALAILLALALLASGVGVYRVSRQSSAVQSVADACALASQEPVAHFYTVAKTCDAVSLSLGLSSALSLGAGLVLTMIPPTASAGASLIDFSKQAFETQKRFAIQAKEGLEDLQQTLPFISAVFALRVAQANNSAEHDFSGLAFLAPMEGLEINVGLAPGQEELIDELVEKQEDLRQRAQQAEEAMRKAREEKLRAYMADCGSAPGHCMHERSEKLAALPGSANPYYANIDTWSFDVAHRRSVAYYRSRLEQERPSGYTSEQVNASIRAAFYQYALDELLKQTAKEEQSDNLHFPLFPKNTQEALESDFGSKPLFPLVNEGGVLRALPSAWFVKGRAVVAWLSLRDLEAQKAAFSQEFPFAVSEVGKVAAATSSTETGFEYHYGIVAQAYQQYKALKAEADPVRSELESYGHGVLGKLFEIIGDLFNRRIKVAPPGRAGSYAVVLDKAQAQPPFTSLVQPTKGLNTRLAVSGAVLVPDSREKSKTVLTELFDGDEPSILGVEGVFDGALSLWSALLEAYGAGAEGIHFALESILGRFSLLSATGLAQDLADTLRQGIADLGFEPADLRIRRPVLLNTAHITQADKSEFSKRWAQLQNQARALSGLSGSDGISILKGLINQEVEAGIAQVTQGFTVAEIGFGAGSVPITISFPEQAQKGAIELIQGWMSTSLDFIFGSDGLRVWQAP